MYLFARRRRINPARMGAAAGAVVEGATRARDIIGFPVWAWASVMSPDVGTAAWTVRVEHLDELESADDKLMSTSDFTEWVEQNDSLFVGPLEDSVLQLVHGTLATEPAAYVQVARGTCANGAIAEAMSFGVEIAEVASRITGLTTIFGTTLTGAYGDVRWVTGVPNLAAVEAGNAALMADDEWRKLVDRAGHAFAPGVTVSLLRRLN